MLELTFNNNSKTILEIYQEPFGEFLKKAYKHLQHLPIPFAPLDYLPNLIKNKNYVIQLLTSSAHKLKIFIDSDLLSDQHYINALHKVYEEEYDGNRIWLIFHEALHHLELINSNHPVNKVFFINYRELSGPFEVPFDRKYINQSTTFIPKGSCVVSWEELGKTPMRYWLDNEPADINRLCELAKPWTKLSPSIMIALEDVDTIPDQEKWKEFCNWFAPFKEEWMRRWNIDKLLDDEISSSSLGSGHQGAKIIIGKVDNVNLILENLDNDIFPQSIKLL